MNASARHALEIRCNAANPVLYLACCGLFDLLARIDPDTLGYWQAPAPAAFHLESGLNEAEFLDTLLGAFCTPTRWRFLPEGAAEPTLVTAAFTPPGKEPFVVPLDWWFETAELDGAIAEKSAWKMFAGQQTVRKITEDMVSEAARLRQRGRLPTDFTSLLACEVEMSGRFGFDPRSSRSALDVGFSSNDLGLPVNTAPFAELLAVFGLASFFPGRAGRAGKLSSSRGWRDRQKQTEKEEASEPGFRYRLWPRPLPVALARVAAARSDADDPMLFSERATRKNYSNLTMAQTIRPNR
jgi:hypothetical protein